MGHGAIASTTSGGLLERGRELSVLADCLATVRDTSHGRVVLVGGEAGVGKTALLRRYCADRGQSVRALWATCDALFTPRPLGPFIDIADETDGELADVVARAARPHEVAAALCRELRARSPTILVLDDVHNGDEATLDVLRLVTRRIETVCALVLVSYRDHELDRRHPLRVVLADLAASGAATRLTLAPLSLPAVAELAEPAGVDADELYRRTSGNPFFVTEALAAVADEIPDTISDAVLGRAARLSPQAQLLIDAVAVVPPPAELRLLGSIAGGGVDRLEECLTSGILVPVAGGVAFRHELARLAVEESLPPNRRLELHRDALHALETSPSERPDLARLAFHAAEAGEADAVLEYAPAAAERAASLGACREAVAHYTQAMRHAHRLPLDGRADLLDRRAYACYVVGDFDAAVETQRQALECARQLGDVGRQGDSLRSLSRLLRYQGRTDEAMRLGWEAVDVLGGHHAGHEVVLAYCNLSHLYMHRDDTEATVEWGRRALEAAEAAGDLEAVVYALTNIGTVEVNAGGDPSTLERALDVARQAGLEEHAGRAFVALTWWSPRGRSYAAADRYFEPGLEYCSERGLDLWRSYLLGYRARSELDRGRWDTAAASATRVLRDERASPVPRVTALAVLGLVRARRGDPAAWPVLDEAWELAAPTEELQRIGPAATARAEAAWLTGRPRPVAEATRLALDLAVARSAWWIVGELASWRRRAGVEEDLPPVPEPWAAELAGDWARAADLWARLGSPYEAALARAEADDEQTARGAVEDLQRLGARPAAAIVARRLRDRGARGVPRGPRPSTQANPANLTAREVEVLGLVAQGMRNAQIAHALVISERTVHHHVSAILRKLGVDSRGQASVEAARLGLARLDG